jgi:HK97 family phage major capsid protein
MPTPAEELRREAKTYTDAAHRLNEFWLGETMPQGVANKIESALNRAEELKARAEEIERAPQYKHDVGLMGSPAPEGGLSLVDQGRSDLHERVTRKEVPIPPEVKMRDRLGYGRLDEEAIYGAFGQALLAQVTSTSPAENAKWAKAIGLDTKDLFTTAVGGALVPDPVSSQIIDLARAASVMFRAGARTVPMSSATLKVPRVTGDVTATWLNEGDTVPLSDPTVDMVTLTARRIEAGTNVTIEMDEDSDPVSVGRLVAQSIAHSIALKVDAAGLRGSGTPPEPRGIRNHTGVTLYAPGANGDALTWDMLLALYRTVSGNNVVPNAFVTTPGARVTLAGLKDGQQNYMSAPAPLLELTHFGTTSVPSNLSKGTSGNVLSEVYLGDFTQAIFGLRVGLSVQVLRELKRLEDRIVVVARMRCDWAIERGLAFAVATHVNG